MCDYKHKYEDDFKDDFGCPHPDYGPGKDVKKTFCIFHSDREDKDAEKFYKEFKKLYESGKHDFRGFIFPKDFNFWRLREETGDLEFKEANFSWVIFSRAVYFSGAIFSGIADFWGATFSGEANFGRAKFSGEAYLWGATFSERAYFAEATFSGEANFFKATFSGEANFWEATFSGGAYFVQAKFSEMADFSGATFSGEAYFAESTFLGEAKFGRAKFSKTSRVIFEGKTFEDSATAYFEYLNIDKDINLTFNGVDLNQTRFFGTDLEKINFKKVYWANMEFETEDEEEKAETIGKKRSETFFVKLKAEYKDFVKRIKGEDRIKVFDENFQTGFSLKEGEEKNHYEVQQLYNQLRMNYEKTGRYHEAGDFFVGAMEMRRKGTREKKAIRKVLTLYKWISLYGERPIRALLWLIVTPFIFLPLYFFNGVTTRPGIDPAYIINYNLVHSTATTAFWSDLGRTLYFSISNIWLGRTFTDLIPENGWTILISIFENITGVVLISLFVLAMNRKFRRTKD